MLDWMQKQKKYLLVTIWIATISFVASGGFSSFSFAGMNSDIGKVGDIKLTQDKFQMEYNNLYRQYSEQSGGKFDEEQAKKMKLQEQVIESMVQEAKLLNLANDFGVLVSDEELANTITSIGIFNKEGKFSKEQYDNYLQNMRIPTKLFENSMKDQIKINKLLSLLNVSSTSKELDNLKMPFQIGDKIKYQILSSTDVNATPSESEVRKFWESKKNNFKTPKEYAFDIVYTMPSATMPSEDEIKKHYRENSFKYIAEGKALSFEDAKIKVIQELQLEDSKKEAYLSYKALKEAKASTIEKKIYLQDDKNLTSELWNIIKTKKIGEVIKPEIVENRYVTLKITNIKEPIVKSFEEAKNEVTQLYTLEYAKSALNKLAEERLKNISNIGVESENYITFDNIEKQNLSLNPQEKSIFFTKLFTSSQEKGIIPLDSKVVIYSLSEQKLLPFDNNQTNRLKEDVDKFKSQSFGSNLIKQLDSLYEVKLN